MISKKLLKNHLWFSIGFLSIIFAYPTFMTYSEEVPAYQVQSIELPNGMKVYLKEDHSAPLVAMAVTVGAGSRTEGEWLGTGVSHLLEHLVFQGTHQGTPSEMAQRIERFGGEVNAYTTPDFTLYYVSLPKDFFWAGLEALAESLNKPTFDVSSLKREKQVVLHEIKMGEDDPNRVLQKLFWKTAYRVHPYRVKTIGHEELLLALSQEDILKYFDKWYTSENISITLVGDFSTQDAVPLIEKQFRFLKRRPFSQFIAPSEPEVLRPRNEEMFGNVQLTRLLLGFHIPPFGDPDMTALDVLVTMAGDGTQSRLYQRLQEDLRITRSVSASTTTMLDSGLFVVSALLPDSQLNHVKGEVLKELERFRLEEVSPFELDRAKRRMMSDFYHQLDTVERQAFWIGVMSFLTGDPQYIHTYLDQIRLISSKDVLRVAKKYLDPQQMISCALRPKSSEPKAERSVAEERQQKIVREKLANGVTLVFCEDHSLPMVSVQAVFKGGVLAENEKTNGLFELLALTGIRGTSTKNVEEILGPIEGWGGDISSYADLNSFGFSAFIPKDHFLDAFQILTDILRSPSFPKQEVEKQKDQLLAAIQSVEESPVSWGLLRFKKELFKDHPYRFLSEGSKESVGGISREGLLEAFEKYARPENLVIVIGGDVSYEVVQGEVKEALSRLMLRKGTLDFPARSLQLKGPVRVQEKREQEQSIVMVGFLGTTVLDSDRYGLEILATMLSGFGSPLFAKIRNELGAAYYVGAFNLFGLDPGAFITYAGTTPENEARVLEIIQQSLEGLKQGPIDDEALLRAKNQLIAGESRDLQVLSARVRQMALLELYGIGVEELERYEARIQSWTKEDLVRIANKYFVEQKQVILMVSPLLKSSKFSATRQGGKGLKVKKTKKGKDLKL